MALISARPDGSTDRQKAANSDDDADLKRAKDLLDLHATVKLAHQDGTDIDLNEARDAVERVLRTL
jgi:hypothetical protein